MNREFFVNAEIEVITFEAEDVITESFVSGDHSFYPSKVNEAMGNE